MIVLVRHREMSKLLEALHARLVGVQHDQGWSDLMFMIVSVL